MEEQPQADRVARAAARFGSTHAISSSGGSSSDDEEGCYTSNRGSSSGGSDQGDNNGTTVATTNNAAATMALLEYRDFSSVAPEEAAADTKVAADGKVPRSFPPKEVSLCCLVRCENSLNTAHI